VIGGGGVECDQESDSESLVPAWKCGIPGVQHGDCPEVIVVMEWVLGCARILYGPRNFSVSFLEGRVVGRIEAFDCILGYRF